ncbi:sensor histidine kinase [Heliobacterium gestii]|uniref:Sensor histidine kinase n=1 Tax=Heliomicrobium gestii TaxID=2699 RepID=A0A845LCI3_HELGE|nr:histidine kinase [Heliomicrobium gestii]MBM7866936.1 two-component system sensor histidine kinase LytS [Heliomicrobium gestii]MZP42359.1 sensor histidine kinase [Heliomicrobium gestii]
MALFLLLRLPFFRSLIQRRLVGERKLRLVFWFGLLAIAGSQAGAVVTVEPASALAPLSEVMGQWASMTADELSSQQAVGPASGLTLSYSHIPLLPMQANQAVLSLAGMSVIGAGLVGGLSVGFAVGAIAGLHLLSLGGAAAEVNAVTVVLMGLLTGWMARRSGESLLSGRPAFAVSLLVSLVAGVAMVMSQQFAGQRMPILAEAVLPAALINALAAAIFMEMLRIASREVEEVALETERALKLTEFTLSQLQQGLNAETGRAIAEAFMAELKTVAVTITDNKYVLVHVGIGEEEYPQGRLVHTQGSLKALETGKLQVVYHHEPYQHVYLDKLLRAAIVIPFSCSGQVIGLLKLYFYRSQDIRPYEIGLAQGLGKLISYQLSLLETEKKSLLLKDAELRMLQAQINPHFLFNSLNAIVSLIRTNPGLARKMMLQLAEFMRMNLKRMDMPLVSLEEELRHLKAYIDIVQLRFADRLTICVDTEPDLSHYRIPPSTLQPLVENSIQHGLKDCSEGGRITVTIARHGCGVQVQVTDNGGGIPESLLSRLARQPLPSQKGNGIGVHNVSQRLASLLGTDSRLFFANLPEGGCEARFFLPDPKEGSVSDESDDRRRRATVS